MTLPLSMTKRTRNSIRDLARWMENYKIIGYKHPMDKHYPHKCFNNKCPEPIKWRDFLNSNGIDIQLLDVNYLWDFKNRYNYYRYLKRLWRSKKVKFYCCKCFTIEIMEEVGFD